MAVADPPSTGGDGFDRQFCGGSLVATTVVLTAAHCVYGNGFQPPSSFSIISGRTTLSSNEGSEQPVVDVIYFVDAGTGAQPQSQTQPPAGDQLYDNDTLEWDVALLELPAAAPSPAAPIAIASAAERGLWEPDDPAFITGWGDRSNGLQRYADTLQEAEVEMISDSNCATPTYVMLGFDPETMVCAGIWPQGGVDTCAGDSGGPLAVPAGDDTYRLVGDTSWGVECGLPMNPGVYGRVADEPMRGAILAGIGFAAATPGGPSAGSPQTPAVDARAPNTSIVKRPPNRTRKRRAVFRFASDEPGSRFQCKLNRKQWVACQTPYRKRVRRGRHTLAVRAIDVTGNIDRSPAIDRWRVRRR